MQTKLTVSIVTYNSESYIAACLKSLKAQTWRDFSVIVVDNASRDRSCELIQQVFPEAKIMRLEKNVGFGAAHNIAIHHAQSDWVLVLNPDVSLEDRCLERLMSAADDHAGAGSVGPCLYRDRNKQILDSAGLEKTWYYHVRDRGQGESYSADHSSSHAVWGLSAACALYRKAALQSVAYPVAGRDYPEYFDEHFFMYKEDVDLAARLQRHGWQAWYCAEAIGSHVRTGRKSSSAAGMVQHRRQLPDHVTTNSYRNHWYFIIKNVPLYSILPVALYEACKLAYVTVFERKALVSLFRHWPTLKLMLQRRFS